MTQHGTVQQPIEDYNTTTGRFEARALPMTSWNRETATITYKSRGVFSDEVLRFEYEVRWWWHPEGHIHEVALKKLDADDAACYGAVIDTQMSPDPHVYHAPDNAFWPGAGPAGRRFRVVELQVSYTLQFTHIFTYKECTDNSVFQITGDGALFRLSKDFSCPRSGEWIKN